MDVAGLIRRRFATQHLTGPPVGVADYVREALCVQSQDPGTARWSLGMRADCDDAAVRQVLDSGEVVRVHALRPTWHCLHRDDLAWVQRLLGEKVASSMPARHRQLGLSSDVIERAFAVLQRELSGTALTRKQLEPLLPATAGPRGQVVGHLLMVAELRGLICSGPLLGNEHSYRLVDEAILATPARDHQDASRELVRRFFGGHGPASVKDLTRWCALTAGQVKQGLAEIDDLTSTEVDGVQLWFDESLGQPSRRRHHRALLLPTFDEAFLSYLKPGIPRSPGNPFGDRPAPFNESGGGLVVIDGHDVGVWKRYLAKGMLRLVCDLDPALTADQLDLVAAQAERLRGFTGASGIGTEIR